MKKAIKISIATLFIIAVALTCASVYFINFALSPAPRNEYNEDTEYSEVKERYPHIAHWLDSIRPSLKNTFTASADGHQLRAIYAYADSATPHTAIIVHGYKSNAVKMMHIAYLFHHCLHYNILLPDLQCHGLSEGDEIQMGWKDKDDVKQWIGIADSIFGGNTQMVVAGISMGGATTMMLSGEQLPSCVKCFIDDCGYTSVWDEFRGELHNQFNLPAFPLLHVTSITNKVWHGWSFTEASALHQVAKCKLPMLFIHGDSDTYVPTNMVYQLYNAKAEPKEIYISKGSAHANSYADHPDTYTAVVSSFVSKYIQP